MTREASLELCLHDAVAERGGKCIKLPAGFIAGLPDRMILLPGKRIFFVELKRDGEKPTLIQAHWIEMLRNLGFSADVVTGRKELNKWMQKNLM